MNSWYEMFCKSREQSDEADYTALVSQSDSISDGINHFPPPELYRRLMSQAVLNGDCLKSYTQSAGHPLLVYGLQQYERMLAGLPPESDRYCRYLCVTVGATAAIQYLFAYYSEARSCRKVVMLGMNYYLFGVCAKRYGMQQALLTQRGAAPCTADACREIARQKGALVILTQPMNPSGELYTEQELTEIMLACKENNCTLVLDMCQMDELANCWPFLNVGGVALATDAQDSVVLINSISKIRSLAGSRIGYIAANDRDLVEYATYMNEMNYFNHSLCSANAIVADLFYRTILRTPSQQWKYVIRQYRNLILQTAGTTLYHQVFQQILKSETLEQDAAKFRKEICDRARTVQENYRFCVQTLVPKYALDITAMQGGLNFCVRLPTAAGTKEADWGKALARFIGSNLLTQKCFCAPAQAAEQGIWLRISAAMEPERFQPYILKMAQWEGECIGNGSKNL